MTAQEAVTILTSFGSSFTMECFGDYDFTVLFGPYDNTREHAYVKVRVVGKNVRVNQIFYIFDASLFMAFACAIEEAEAFITRGRDEGLLDRP